MKAGAPSFFSRSCEKRVGTLTGHVENQIPKELSGSDNTAGDAGLTGRCRGVASRNAAILSVLGEGTSAGWPGLLILRALPTQWVPLSGNGARKDRYKVGHPPVAMFLQERNVMTVKGIRLCHDS